MKCIFLSDSPCLKKKKSNTGETCGKYNHIEQLNFDGKWEVTHLKNHLATFFLIYKENKGASYL